MIDNPYNHKPRDETTAIKNHCLGGNQKQWSYKNILLIIISINKLKNKEEL